MSETRESINVMIAYLLQVMYERGEMLRKTHASKEAERDAGVILTLSRSISILREDYGMYDKLAADQPEPAAPQPEQDAPEENAPDEEAQAQE